MQYYVGSTIAESLMTIRRQRLLPTQGDVVVRAGQEVSEMQVVARAPQRSDFKIFPASEILRISPEELQARLLVEEGSVVEQGSVLVEKRGLFGKALISPMDGIFYRARKGRIVLQRTADWIELRALMRGRVVDQIPNRGVVLEADGSLIQAVWSSGKESHGKLMMVAKSGSDPMVAEEISAEAHGSVLVTGVIDKSDALEKCEKAGVHGIIAGSMNEALCSVATALSFPVIVTDGFGNAGMATPFFDLLRQAEGRKASMFGQMAPDDVSRPEIIIVVSTAPKVGTPDLQPPLAVGRQVRILRRPYSGQAGKVVRVYDKIQTTSIGTRTHGADVKLADGQEIFVPYVNLEIMVS
jgi:hypothetical protein